MQNRTTRNRPHGSASWRSAARPLIGLGLLYLLGPYTALQAFAHGNLEPYRWVSPPAQFLKDNVAPSAGHLTVKTMGGVTTAGGAATDDGQAQLSFERGAFSGSVDVTIDIEPVSQFPAPAGFEPATNVYLIRASAPLAKPATATLAFSPAVAAPSIVYSADPGAGDWRRLASTPFRQTGVGQLITAQVDHLPVYVVAAAAAASVRVGGSRSSQSGLGILAGLLLVAAIPVLLLGKLPLFRVVAATKRGKKRRNATSRKKSWHS